MASTPLIPVILCGGTGTRLWPLSRASYPKQYWPLNGDGDATLLQQTQQRLTGMEDLAPPLLICNEDHRFIVAEQMRQIGVEPNAILLEPMGHHRPGRDGGCTTGHGQWRGPPTAGAGGRSPDPRCRPVPPGHRRRPHPPRGRLVTFGIVPTAPETGYGYIEASEPFS